MEWEHGSGQMRVLIYNIFERLNTEHINKMEGQVMGKWQAKSWKGNGLGTKKFTNQEKNLEEFEWQQNGGLIGDLVWNQALWRTLKKNASRKEKSAENGNENYGETTPPPSPIVMRSDRKGRHKLRMLWEKLAKFYEL